MGSGWPRGLLKKKGGKRKKKKPKKKKTYPVLRLFRLIDRLHDTALLVRDFAHPVALPRGDEDVCAPARDVAVEQVALLHLEIARVAYGAAVAVAGAVVAVDLGRRAREQLVRRRGPVLLPGTLPVAAQRELPRPIQQRLEPQCHLLLQRPRTGW